MPQDPASEFDVLNKVFETRLRQADMERILDHLDTLDRRELVTKMTQMLRRMTALLDVTNQTSTSLSLDDVLPQSMTTITETLRVERSSLFLYDGETDELFSRVAQGDGIGEIRVPAGAGIAGTVFKTSQSVTIADA
ncbi:MAG: GAF domain-containing protein [Alphaproteobacteria bacterium]|nr:GAF domain-containing protein [Alphaproteobacteria bacterium]